jgi:hypothetical protein
MEILMFTVQWNFHASLLAIYFHNPFQKQLSNMYQEPWKDSYYLHISWGELSKITHIKKLGDDYSFTLLSYIKVLSGNGLVAKAFWTSIQEVAQRTFWGQCQATEREWTHTMTRGKPMPRSNLGMSYAGPRSSGEFQTTLDQFPSL